ncbi:MAG: DUF4276 family protein [bacterium]|nr:DUF4276 family protein [bacterium]
MHLEILVEEPSAKEALKNLLPKIIGSEHTFQIHPHQGKPDLLNKLPKKLKAYRRYISSDVRIVILVDLDSEDCNQLKRKLDNMAEQAGFRTKTTANKTHQPNFQVLNRLVIKELEAWFLGDFQAIHSAFPKVPWKLRNKKQHIDPDSIIKPSKALERMLQKYNYYKNGLQKLDCAKKISAHMDPNHNSSVSFNQFKKGISAFL